MWWIISIGYVIGFFVAGRTAYILCDKYDAKQRKLRAEKEKQHKYVRYDEYEEFDEWETRLVTIGAAIFWPAVLVIVATIRLWNSTIARETARQKKERLAKEAKKREEETQKLIAEFELQGAEEKKEIEKEIRKELYHPNHTLKDDRIERWDERHRKALEKLYDASP